MMLDVLAAVNIKITFYAVCRCIIMKIDAKISEELSA
jgi:hypothetical protein